MTLTKTDLSKIKTVVKSEIKQELRPVKFDLKVLKKDVKKIKKDTSYTANNLDKATIKLHKRTERIEDHLNLPPIPEHAFV